MSRTLKFICSQGRLRLSVALLALLALSLVVSSLHEPLNLTTTAVKSRYSTSGGGSSLHGYVNRETNPADVEKLSYYEVITNLFGV